jgi:hypothetical protein
MLANVLLQLENPRVQAGSLLQQALQLTLVVVEHVLQSHHISCSFVAHKVIGDELRSTEQFSQKMNSSLIEKRSDHSTTPHCVMTAIALKRWLMDYWIAESRWSNGVNRPNSPIIMPRSSCSKGTLGGTVARHDTPPSRAGLLVVPSPIRPRRMPRVLVPQATYSTITRL